MSLHESNALEYILLYQEIPCYIEIWRASLCVCFIVISVALTILELAAILLSSQTCTTKPGFESLYTETLL